MKKLFYIGVIFFVLFEIGNVYFIMPIPGSQDVNSIDLAYFLYIWRWWVRCFLGAIIILGFKTAFLASKWMSAIVIIIIVGIIYATNFKMAADTMFYQPTFLQFKDTSENKVGLERLVIGVNDQGQAKAFPIQFLGYHHQVRDSIGGKPIMVTYCTVCRSGRVYEPIVNGKTEYFRLVGMDHFNAMFEDKTSQSWWRQATGDAIAGPLKGQFLPVFFSTQMTLRNWIKLYPHTLIMQPDQKFKVEYDSMSTYEAGRLKGKLTRRDTASWQPKSWVIGVIIGNKSKAFDWNKLQKECIIHDKIENKPIVVVLAEDGQSFFAFERHQEEQFFALYNDTLIDQNCKYALLGKYQNVNCSDLKQLSAYQEYWHSWQTFHPTTKR